MYKKIKILLLTKSKMLTDTRVLGILAFGVVSLLVTWSGVKVVQTNYELDKKISVSKQKNDIAKLENENLRLQNTYYESNQYLELAARRQFGKAEKGEKLYVVPKEVALSYTVDMPKQDEEIVKDTSKKPKYQQNLEAWSNFIFR